MVRDAIPLDVDLHVLGFAKADDLAEFRSFRITSFDTTSPLLRAFKDNKSNYYLRRPDGRLDYYTAIRVPQAIENTKLLRLAKQGTWQQEDLLALERRALSALRAYDREEIDLEDALDAVMAYGTPAMLGERRTPPRLRRLRNWLRAMDERYAIAPGRHAPVPFAAKPRLRSCYSAPATATSAAAFTTLASSKRSSTTCQTWSLATPMDNMTFSAVSARQSPSSVVLSFAAKVTDVLRFAVVDRVARDAEGRLSGFQRPQIAAHIREIRDYLAGPEAVLPNPIVVAFTSSLTVASAEEGLCRVTIDLSNGPPGLVVDGQQRLSALAQIEDKDFEVFISALVCRDEAELRRQFVLINNTRPLPKTLIYELLPTVDGGLPKRLSDRTIAADLTARLNHDPVSSLRGQINQHTNPSGIISDTAVQKVILNSLSDGALRQLAGRQQALDRCSRLLSDFYGAVQYVFADAWAYHTPRTSRLVHGAGVVAMGYVMEELHRRGAETDDEFRRGLGSLVGRTAWTAGEWDLGDGDRRHWKAIQNTGRDIVTLAQYLVRVVRADARARLALEAEERPLLKLARM